ncbi:hypothetical protein [Noviherbaspirillum sp. Root189]|uniref:hypothetical protein n=1 Tax=Noviherbaspirillum sp. Root189 TaxID=1736487 RepID=UPI00070909C0|nr:hypothetical protein [Noviherbaspirillum sp. Root189]KRB89145.1 hypothetical protein ASE07_03225 [Noviherbaspirillum sp. Root189]
MKLQGAICVRRAAIAHFLEAVMSHESNLSRHEEHREMRRILGAELRGPTLDMAEMQFSVTRRNCEPQQAMEALTMLAASPAGSDLP